jgi:hypothetical protein
MSLVIAAADTDGTVLGAAAAVAAGLGVDAVMGAALGEIAAEHAAIATASAGTRRAMDRFMTGSFPSGFGSLLSGG